MDKFNRFGEYPKSVYRLNPQFPSGLDEKTVHNHKEFLLAKAEGWDSLLAVLDARSKISLSQRIKEDVNNHWVWYLLASLFGIAALVLYWNGPLH